MKGDDAACLHDYLYRTHRFPRARCDWLLRDAMLSQGVPSWKCFVIYWVVRMVGGTAYYDQPKGGYEPGNFGKRLANGQIEDH